MSEARTPSGAGPRGAAANGSVNGAPAQPLPADPAALERIIDERRRRLAATVDELVLRAQPKEIARRGASDVQARLRAAVYTDDGRLRVERVGAVAAAVVTLVALIVWRRRSR
jgi:hypothetical protein